MSCLQNIEMKIIVFIFLISHCSGEYCSYRKGRTNKNKGNCTELEHCVSNFDNQTGQCPGNQCEPGWMGPGCQYVNLAFNPQRDQVFDGNMGTSRSISDGRALVLLNGTFFVHAIRIHSSTYDGSLLVQDKNTTVLFNNTFPQTKPTIFLYHTSLTDQLTIQFDPSLSIKEIEVFGGKNVALWKSTNQSSTYSEGTIHFSSDKAVDGSGNGDFDTGHTCTHTEVGYSNPTWNVILGDLYYITSIKIKNRNTHQDRLGGFELFGTTESGLKLSIYRDLLYSSDSSEIFLDSTHMLDKAVNEITIKIPSSNAILTLCEVYIYASFRRKKNNYCSEKCQTENLCNNVNFTCPVCEHGWEGPYCTRFQAIECLKPQLPAFVTISPDKQEYAYGETVTFGCPPGYILDGALEKTCLHSADLRQNLPSCAAIKCPKPPLPAFVTISPIKWRYAYGETVTFGCNSGYTLNGDKVKTCLQSSDLGQNLPSCTAIKCPKPPLPAFVTISPDKREYAYGETVTFGCPLGYTFNGDRMKACLHSSDLGQNLPSCSAITCSKPQLPASVTISPNKWRYAYGEIVTFGCRSGYTLNGDKVKTCLQSSDLGQNLPFCAAITCGRPVLSYPLHISANSYKTSYNYNDSIEFTCSLGFTIQNPSVKYCTYTDAFQHNLPGCKEVKCSLPTFQQKDILLINPNETLHDFNSSVHFTCKDGFYLNGPQSVSCQQNGSFGLIGNLPSCSELLPEAKPIAAIISGSVGGILVFAGIVIVVFIVLRKRSGKKAEFKYYKNDALSLDNIDNQYSEVNIDRSKRKKATETSKQDEASNEQTSTYYNLNNTDVIKAQKPRQEVYYEFSPVYRPSETAVSVSEFKYFVDCKKRNNKFFAEQFKKFYTGLQFPATAALAPGNRAKNKYKNIYPYDETRVLLKIEKDYSESDFINASIIHGFGNVKSYIAAQGPLINTIDDFWWMVWNEECDKIVMLTNLIEDDKVKCIQYWPEDDAMDTRNMKLELVDSESFADFTIRTLKLINGAEHRTIRQFHFTAWPDKGVPLYASSLVHFHSKVIHTETNLKGPMIVHCSAGIGRTGTFIALNYLVQQAKESGYVDVFECVNTLRRQRLNMVQTLEQYKFLHDATLEALMCTSSDPSSAEFPRIYEDLLKVDAETGKRNIDLNFENLGLPSSSLPESAYSFAKNSINRRKNRFSNILPVDSEMPQIRDEENNPIYINAVFLPAYKTKRSFIATQMPLKDTVVDFWRLLYEQQVSTIVMLNQLDSGKPKENIGKYWPEDLNAISEFGPFRITKKGFTEGTDFNIIDLCCHKKGQNENDRKLRLFQCQFWPDSSTVPTSVLSFLKLINDVELHHDRNNSGPVVVHCMNGAEKSGLFCVMQVVLERMKIEQDVAIHHVIQQMRSIRPSIIPNAEQFKFCHDVVLEFLKQFDDYSNFQ